MFLSPGSRAKPRRRTINGQTGSVVILGEPGGRLTLTSAMPVLTGTVSGATTVYYALYKHNWILIYDGTNFIPTTFAELSQATTDTTKSPAAVVAGKNYDDFVWNDSGTIRATRGPAWSSDTARGTGAGTTELIQVNGVWLNKIAITNGPGAQRGTYVGTIRANASGTIDYIFGAAAAGGTAGSFGVWNFYNRIPVRTIVSDTNSTWTWNSATFHVTDASSTMRVSFVRGFDMDGVNAVYYGYAIGPSGTAYFGIGLDSTSVTSGVVGLAASSAIAIEGTASYGGLPGLGVHFLQALEAASVGTANFYGFSSGAYQSGMSVDLFL